jgi:hypothetical protein
VRSDTLRDHNLHKTHRESEIENNIDAIETTERACDGRRLTCSTICSVVRLLFNPMRPVKQNCTGDRKWPLNDGQIPHFRVARVGPRDALQCCSGKSAGVAKRGVSSSPPEILFVRFVLLGAYLAVHGTAHLA